MTGDLSRDGVVREVGDHPPFLAPEFGEGAEGDVAGEDDHFGLALGDESFVRWAEVGDGLYLIRLGVEFIPRGALPTGIREGEGVARDVAAAEDFSEHRTRVGFRVEDYPFFILMFAGRFRDDHDGGGA